MASSQWSVVLRHVERLFHGGAVAGLTEGQLLDRFVTGRDEVAFGALVARHGPMVLGVCRGVLDDPHDVDDAFQSTFLVLVRKAAGLRDRERLAQWLYGVARKVALRARADASRRKARERSGPGREPESAGTFDAELRELRSMVREEVDRLRADERMAIVLCYLDGLTHEEAADRLGWPVGTVKGRLARARERLRDRLVRRGVVLPAAVVTSTLARQASAAVPAELIRITTLAAIRVAAGESLTAGVVSAHAVALMEGVIGTMFTTKLKLGTLALVASCVFAVPGVMALQNGGPEQSGAGAKGRPTPTSPKPPVGPEFAKTQGKSQPTTDFVVQPPDQPTDSVVRPPNQHPGEGAQVRLAEQALEWLADLERGQVPFPRETKYLWSRRLLEAQTGPGASRADRIQAFQSYLDRMKKYRDEDRVRAEKLAAENGGIDRIPTLEAEFRCLEAEKWLAEAQAEPPAPAKKGALRRSPGANRPVAEMAAADEERNKAIQGILEERVSMNFANDTPLEDVLKYIGQCTQDEKRGFPNGIPIYVDPKGLKNLGETMASTVKINLEGIPLRTTLRLLLSQIDLSYSVEDGLLIIAYLPPIGGPQ